MIIEDIQSDETIPAQYEMTEEELAEFYCEYTEWSEQNKQPDEDRPLYIWLR